mgnify:CR=1 FL=1
MKITPKLQSIMYGTFVSIGVTVSGLLWWERTGPEEVKVTDYIELYQATRERILAMEYGSPAAYPAAQVYTNHVINWIPDTNGYYVYSGGVKTLTNYWKSSGYNEMIVWTNVYNRLYGQPPVSGDIYARTRYMELPVADSFLTGSEHRYIWNQYTTISVTGMWNGTVGPPFTTNGLGTYVLITNGTTMALNDWFENASGIFVPLSELAGNGNYQIDAPCRIYSNTTLVATHKVYVWWLLDFGPLDSYGGTYSSRIIRGFSLGVYQGAGVTLAGESPINGPWYGYYVGNSPASIISTNIIITTSNASTDPKMLMDAPCRWWVGTKGPDGRYIAPDFGLINPYVTVPKIDYLDNRLLSRPYSDFSSPIQYPLAHPYSRYIVTNTAVAGEYVGFTNQSQFIALNSQFTATNVCLAAGIPVHWTNGFYITPDGFTNWSKVRVRDIDRLARASKQFNWMSSPGIYGPSSSRIGGTVVTNVWTGYGYSTVSWADAQYIATTNFHPTSVLVSSFDNFSIIGSYTFGQNHRFSPGWGGFSEWFAYIRAVQVDLIPYAVNTQLVADADFYVFSSRYPINSSPWTEGDIANQYDATHSGYGGVLSTNQYVRIATVSSQYATNRYITIGSINIPPWCDDPTAPIPIVPEIRTNNIKGYAIGRYSAPPYYFSTIRPTQVIMKWHFNYLTDYNPVDPFTP